MHRCYQQENSDVVDICSRNASHAAQGIAAKAGKHVLMEKPVAITLEELRRLARAITTAGAKSLAGFGLHWSPYLDIVTSMIVRDFFGTLYFGDTGYISGRRPPVVRRIRLGQDIFAPCIVHDHTPPPAITDAVKAHEIIVAAEQPALDGKPVKLLLPPV